MKITIKSLALFFGVLVLVNTSPAHADQEVDLICEFNQGTFYGGFTQIFHHVCEGCDVGEFSGRKLIGKWNVSSDKYSATTDYLSGANYEYHFRESFAINRFDGSATYDALYDAGNDHHSGHCKKLGQPIM